MAKRPTRSETCPNWRLSRMPAICRRWGEMTSCQSGPGGSLAGREPAAEELTTLFLPSVFAS